MRYQSKPKPIKFVVMLESEFKYFLDNQEELVDKYEGKTIVVIGSEVVGVFDNEVDAYTDSVKKYELGTFLIQDCIAGEAAYTQTFHNSIVSF